MAIDDTTADNAEKASAAQNTADTSKQQGKQFTQADIDAIVEDRLGRDRRTREEALAKELGMSLKDAKALIKARKAEEDANKSELQREREARAKAAEATLFALLNDNQKEFISFVLSKYIESGIDELEQDKLPTLLTNKYQSLEDAKEILGDTASISKLFVEFQEYLYKQEIA